jgi:hypothetical protein
MIKENRRLNTNHNIYFDSVTKYAPRKSKDLSITSGPRAFEVFLEEHNFVMSGNFSDVTNCV